MEKILETVSPFGKYQKLVTVLIGLASSLTAMLVFSTVFTAARPKFACRLLDSGGSGNGSGGNASSTSQEFLNDTDTCTIWKQIQSNHTVTETHECVFDTRHFGTTIVTEWHLVCDRTFMASLTVTLFMLGSFSSLAAGYFSDQYGRKTCSLAMLAGLTVSLLVSQCLQFELLGMNDNTQYIIYLIAQMAVGACGVGLFAVNYVLLVEVTTPKYATIVSNVNLYMYVFGELVVALVAYFARNWHIITWFMISYSLVILILCALFLPESPRYLMEHKKYKQLCSQLKRIARINDAKMQEIEQNDSAGLISNIMNSTYFEKTFKLNVELEEPDKEPKIETSILKYIIDNHAVKTLLLSFIWFSLSMTYYGVSLGITNVGNINPYLMYTLSSVSELVGYILCHFNDKLGRKRLFVVFLGLASLMCLLVALIQLFIDVSSSSSSGAGVDSDQFLADPKKLALMAATFAGKATTSAAFNSAFVYTSHLFPTRVRNTLLLFVSSVGRVGSVISPQINLLGDLVLKQMPYLIFSACSFVGCLFIVLLPDPFVNDNL